MFGHGIHETRPIKNQTNKQTNQRHEIHKNKIKNKKKSNPTKTKKKIPRTDVLTKKKIIHVTAVLQIIQVKETQSKIKAVSFHKNTK